MTTLATPKEGSFYSIIIVLSRACFYLQTCVESVARRRTLGHAATLILRFARRSSLDFYSFEKNSLALCFPFDHPSQIIVFVAPQGDVQTYGMLPPVIVSLVAWLLLLLPSCNCAMRRTERIDLPNGIGSRYSLLMHRYGPTSPTVPQAYIQASLHADELPGLLVSSHLVRLLDEAEARGEVLQRVCVVPFANPIGLSQHVLGTHIGRFSTETGVNFNRNWPDVTQALIAKFDDAGAGLREGHDADACTHNVGVIRAAILGELDAKGVLAAAEPELKRRLLREAAVSDVCLDLHCDSEAILHMYTHTRLWPALSDLSAEMQSHCQLLASVSGGNPFDETASSVWAALQDRFPLCGIPMACQSATIELRGEQDVTDANAAQDAAALMRFLQRRGYVAAPASDLGPPPPLLREASPLEGVDMVEAQCAGLIVWRVEVGQSVRAGELLGEIVDMEDPDKPRVPVAAKTSGVVFGRRRQRLAVPGQVIIKVAGGVALEWRSGGPLLTSR